MSLMQEEEEQHGAEEDEGAADGEDDKEEDDDDETPDSVMKEVDSNHDGKISLAELQKRIDDDDTELQGKHPDQQTFAAIKEESKAENARIAGLFTKADLDKDGFLDAKELPAFLKVVHEADAKERAADEKEDAEDKEEKQGEQKEEKQNEGGAPAKDSNSE